MQTPNEKEKSPETAPDAPDPPVDAPHGVAAGARPWNSLLAAQLQAAGRKIGILHYRIVLDIFGRETAAQFRPKGLLHERDERPFTEEELERRLERIFRELDDLRHRKGNQDSARSES